MAEQMESTVFQPFFTARPIGEGTGLGLLLSYDIVTKGHGELFVQSTEGEGSEFIISLPGKYKVSILYILSLSRPEIALQKGNLG